MNKLFKWFYTRQNEIARKELGNVGLQIIDDKKFHDHIIKITKKNIRNNIIFLIIVIIIILRWIFGG
jgi:hypothetical protein